METSKEEEKSTIFTKEKGEAQALKKNKIDRIAISALIDLLVAIIEKKQK